MTDARAAVKATAQRITDDNARAVEMGAESIPADEVISVPNSVEFVAPDYLEKTAPHLAPEFGELLVRLRDFNDRFAGERTVDAQAALSLTGEHEWLEDKFLCWCQTYFKIRGSLGRLSPRNGNDPWRLYQDCFVEFSNLLEKRIVQPGTINSSVLNLSQRFMLSGFALQVLGPDLTTYSDVGRDRYSTKSSRLNATRLIAGYSHEVEAFTAFLDQIANHLPPAYAPNDSAAWLTETRSKVEHRAEDLSFLRNVLCVLNVSDAEKHQLAPDLWARLTWDVYHGGSVAALLTSRSPEPSTERVTQHLLSFRRNGWLCHREYTWLFVEPDFLTDERRAEIAVSWFVLDTLTSPLYEAWGRLDPGLVLARGYETDATDEEQNAAIAVALAKPEPTRTEKPTAREKKARVHRLWLSEFEKVTTKHFQCIWSHAKGSERKVFREGSNMFVFGCHGSDRQVSSAQIQSCLRRLGISTRDFLAACQ